MMVRIKRNNTRNASVDAVQARRHRGTEERVHHHSLFHCCQSCFFCLPSTSCLSPLSAINTDRTLASASKDSTTLPLTPSSATGMTVKTTPSKESPSKHEDSRSEELTFQRTDQGSPTIRRQQCDDENRNIAPSKSPFRLRKPRNLKHQRRQPLSKVTKPSNIGQGSEVSVLVTPSSQASGAMSGLESLDSMSESDNASAASLPHRSLFDYTIDNHSSEADDEDEGTEGIFLSRSSSSGEVQRSIARIEKRQLEPLLVPPPPTDDTSAGSFRSALEYLMDVSGADRDSTSAVCSDDYRLWYQTPMHSPPRRVPPTVSVNEIATDTPREVSIRSPSDGTEGRVSPISDPSLTSVRSSEVLSASNVELEHAVQDHEIPTSTETSHAASIATGLVSLDDSTSSHPVVKHETPSISSSLSSKKIIPRSSPAAPKTHEDEVPRRIKEVRFDLDILSRTESSSFVEEDLSPQTSSESEDLPQHLHQHHTTSLIRGSMSEFLDQVDSGQPANVLDTPSVENADIEVSQQPKKNSQARCLNRAWTIIAVLIGGLGFWWICSPLRMSNFFLLHELKAPVESSHQHRTISASVSNGVDRTHYGSSDESSFFPPWQSSNSRKVYESRSIISESSQGNDKIRDAAASSSQEAIAGASQYPLDNNHNSCPCCHPKENSKYRLASSSDTSTEAQHHDLEPQYHWWWKRFWEQTLLSSPTKRFQSKEEEDAFVTAVLAPSVWWRRRPHHYHNAFIQWISRWKRRWRCIVQCLISSG